MSTGSLENGVCWETFGLAVDEHFSLLPPYSYLAANGKVTVVQYEKINSVWWQEEVSYNVTGAPTVVYISPADLPNFASCYAPSESFADGVNIGWAFAGTMTIILFVLLIKKALHV